MITIGNLLLDYQILVDPLPTNPPEPPGRFNRAAAGKGFSDPAAKLVCTTAGFESLRETKATALP
jgi:hypothetical protein